MKKILFLIHALNLGGAQRVLVDTANSMDLDKYDITIQTIYNCHHLKSELDPRIHVKSIIRTENGFLSGIARYLIRRILPLTWVYNLWIKDGYDYEVAFLEGEPTRLLAFSTEKEAKRYAWVHTDLMHNTTAEGLYKSDEDYLHVYRQYDRIICVSQSSRDAFAKRFGFDDNVIVRRNVVAEKMIMKKAAMEVSDYQPGKGLQLLMVSNLRPEKRHCMLLRVLRKLHDEGHAFTLHIVGDGSERQKIENLIAELDMSNYVRMLGRKENPYPYMKKADAFVLSSSAEGYSMVTIEACLLGLPVLTTDCTGQREILADGSFGMIVPNDENGLYAGVKLLLTEGKKALSMYKEQLAKFRMAEGINAIEELFEG